MKKLVPIVTATVMVCAAFFGNSILSAMAKESGKAKLYRYYDSIVIEEGDSLWSISERYNRDNHMDIRNYIEDLKNMNQLKQDTIHAGQYLTIVYFSEEHR